MDAREHGTTGHAADSLEARGIEASILVVAYKSRGYIERCLAGAIASLRGERVEILFVDCSDDGSEAFVRGRFPEVRILPHCGNLGFARGNNELAKLARGEKILLLNPDVFAESDEIARLLAFSRERADASAWAGVTVLPDGSIDGGSVQGMLGALPAALALVGLARIRPGAADPHRAEIQRAPVLTGAFMMVRADRWRALGGFDETYFMYAEEVDLCKRLADAGGTLLVDPRIRILHDTGSGNRHAPTRLFNRARGNATFYRKHFGPLWAEFCCTLLLAHAAVKSTWARLRGRAATAEGFGAVVARRSEWWNGWPAQPR